MRHALCLHEGHVGILCLCLEQCALNFDTAIVWSDLFRPVEVVCLSARDYHIIETWATDGEHKDIVCLYQARDECYRVAVDAWVKTG